ncbi:MAG: hypothetical protein ACOVQX_01765 [Legionella sp.]
MFKLIVSCIFMCVYSALVDAGSPMTKRISQFTNDKVSVWKTIIYPIHGQSLKMHRHEHDRVVVALTDGRLKVTNNQGQVHFLNFKKNQAYYLTRDIPNELHMDENLSSHPIEVMVIELNFNSQ